MPNRNAFSSKHTEIHVYVEDDFNFDFLFTFSTGISIHGQILVNAGFVSLDGQFKVQNAPRLSIHTDVDFSGAPKLCMQVTQPNGAWVHEIEKNQIIPEIKHHVKAINKFTYGLGGRSHFLSEKNNFMCRLMYA